MEVEKVIKVWNESLKNIDKNNGYENFFVELQKTDIFSYKFPFCNLLKNYYDKLIKSRDEEEKKKFLKIFSKTLKKIREKNEKIKELYANYEKSRDIIEKALINGYISEEEIKDNELKNKLQEVGITILRDAKEKLEIALYDDVFYLVEKEKIEELGEIMKRKEKIMNELQVINAKKQAYVLTNDEEKEFEKKQLQLAEELKKLESFIKIVI
jgi:hypothetical protein